MTTLEALLRFCEKRLIRLDAEQFAAFKADADNRPLQDFNVGQVWTYEDRNYCVPNPPSTTRDEFHALRAAWQQESAE